MKYCIYISVFLLVILYSCVYAQTEENEISGQVTDASNGQPLPFVHVYLKSSLNGDVTDFDGNYILRFNKIPDTLIVSCIGYATRKMPVNSLNDHHFYFPLKPKTESLSEVVISAETIQIVFKDNQYSVLDYELDGDNIYLLIYRNRLERSELLLISQTGDTLSRNTNLPGKPLGLFKDCLDEVHFVSDEWAWQIFMRREKISFRYPSTIEKFAETFSECITSLGDHIFFRKYLLYNLAVEYYAVDKFDSRTITLATIRDEFKLNMLKKNPEDRMMLSSVPAGPGIMDDLIGTLESRGAYSLMRQASWQIRYLEKVVYTPVKAPLKRIDENLVIFDFPNSKMSFFDPNGNKFYEVAISFHHTNTERNILEGLFKSKGWEEYDVYVDEEKYKAYALITDGGKYTLKEIDLFTGNLTNTYKLYYPYPEKITVSNGYVYFLYKPYSDWTKKRLYKQRL